MKEREFKYPKYGSAPWKFWVAYNDIKEIMPIDFEILDEAERRGGYDG